jgi:hypothetical protein
MSYRAAVLADNPIAYWRLDEASGDAIDLVGGVHAAYTAAPTYAVTGLLASDTDTAVSLAAGKEAKSPSIVGLSEPDDFTLECLIKMPSTAGGGKCFVSVNNTATDPWVLFTDSGTDLFLQIHTADGVQNCGVAANLQANTIYHIIGRYLAGVATLWVNGTLVKTQAITGGAPIASDHVWIGKATFGYSYVGVEDEVAVYTHGLASDRIAVHYSESLTPSEDNNDIFDQDAEFVPSGLLDEAGEFIPSGLIG